MTEQIGLREYARIFTSRRIGAILLLGFASGLPLALTGTALTAWYTKTGVATDTIGFLTLIGLPYTLKFLWAPLMDRFVPPFLGRRRGWILVMQIVLAAVIAAMSFMDPAVRPVALGAVALLAAFMSASQDIAFNAYMVDVLPARERGIGAAVQTWGYRGGMYVSGGLALIIAEFVGWHINYLIMAALMGIGVIATLFAPNPSHSQRPPLDLRKAVIEPFTEFLSRKNALALLALVVLYKMGDAFAASLTTTFLLRDAGFSLIDVGGFYKIVSIFTTILGVLFGGMILTKLRLFRAMFLFGCLQALAIFGYMILAIVGKDYVILFAALICEHIAWGMGTAALLTLIMALCNHRYSATQFALLTALDSIGRVFIGPLAGYVAQVAGWPIFYECGVVAALPGLILLWELRERIHEVEYEFDVSKRAAQ